MLRPAATVFRVGRRSTALVLAALALTAVGGCNGGSFVPPPAPELNSLSAQVAPADSTSVTMILPPGAGEMTREWEQSARMEAGIRRAIFAVIRPDPTSPPSRQAELIKAESSRGTSVLLVDPADAPEVAEALKEAVNRGTTVVVIGRGLPDADSSRPLPRVAFVPYEEPARRLVEAVAAEVKSLGLPADGHALIVVRVDDGPDVRVPADVISKALKGTGFTRVEVVEVAGEVAKINETVGERVAADPKVTAVIGFGEAQVSAAVAARDALKPKPKPKSKSDPTRELALGAIMSSARIGDTNLAVHCAGVLDISQPELARQAVRHALRLARGETTSAVKEIPIPLLDRPAPAPAPESAAAPAPAASDTK